MSFIILHEDLPQSATFGHLAPTILSSGKNFKGKLYTEDQLRIHLTDFMNKWLSSPTRLRSEFWDSYLAQKFPKRDQALTYTLSLISSVHKYQETSQELQFLCKVLNDHSLTKDTCLTLKKLKDSLLQSQGLAKSAPVNLDKTFIPKGALITICNKNFPKKLDLSLEIVHWVKDQKHRSTQLKKTNKDLAACVSNNISRGSDPSLSLLLEFFLGLLKKDEREKVSREHKTNMNILKKVEDFGNSVKKHQNWNEIDEYGCLIDPHGAFEQVSPSREGGPEVYVHVDEHKHHGHDLESERLENQQILDEFEDRKLTIQAETEDLARKISQRKQAMAMMRGLISNLHDEKSKVNGSVKNMHQLYSKIRDANAGDRKFMSKLVHDIGFSGFNFLNDGSGILEDLESKSVGILKSHGIKVFEQVNFDARKMGNYIKSKTKAQTAKIYSEPNLFMRKKEKKLKRNEGLQENWQCLSPEVNRNKEMRSPNSAQPCIKTDNAVGKFYDDLPPGDSGLVDSNLPENVKTDEMMAANDGEQFSKQKNKMMNSWKVKDSPKAIFALFMKKLQEPTPIKPQLFVSDWKEEPEDLMIMDGDWKEEPIIFEAGDLLVFDEAELGVVGEEVPVEEDDLLVVRDTMPEPSVPSMQELE